MCLRTRHELDARKADHRQLCSADSARPSGLSKGPIPVPEDEAPRAAVIGENEGRGMPDMAGEVPSEAEPSASSHGTLTPQQVIAATVREASASMQEQVAKQNDDVQHDRARSNQPSLLPNGLRGNGSAVNGGLESRRIDNP